MPDVPADPPVSPGAVPARTGRWARLVDRLTSTQDQVEAAELQVESRFHGATPIATCGHGQQVVVRGTLRSVSLRPRSGVQALEAEMYDGSGRLTLVWLGRRRIRGIEPGRVLVATGRLTHHDDRPMMFNPRYALRPVATE